jgi:hypothetical protein
MMPHLDNLRSGLLLLKSPTETEKFTWEMYIKRKKTIKLQYSNGEQGESIETTNNI